MTTLGDREVPDGGAPSNGGDPHPEPGSIVVQYVQPSLLDEAGGQPSGGHHADRDARNSGVGAPELDLTRERGRPGSHRARGRSRRPVPRRFWFSLRRQARGALREQFRTPTLLLMLFIVLAGFPVTLVLTPDQDVTVLGQHVSVGARSPELSLQGPAQLVQIGNTELDLVPMQVYGPLRPKLTLGPVQRQAAQEAVQESKVLAAPLSMRDGADAIDKQSGQETVDAAVATLREGFLRWYAWGGLILLGFALAATGVAACIRMLGTLRRESRGNGAPLSASDLWRRSTGQIRGMVVAAVSVSLLSWSGAGALAVKGVVDGVRSTTSLTQLFGASYVPTPAYGETIHGYVGAVIGDSRASRVGGLISPSEEDHLCERTNDSLAAELSKQLRQPVLNLACSSASISAGLRGPQYKGPANDRYEVPPQVGRLQQVEGLRYVVVVIGPNDLNWADQLFYCYAVAGCQDKLSEGEFEYRLADFDRDYGDLLQDLNNLPGQPQVIIVTSYDAFDPNASCPDVQGPPGSAGLTPETIALLTERTAQLNQVLVAGADKYGFAHADPNLSPLCSNNAAQFGPDLQSLSDGYPFHPTALGIIRMAASVARVVNPA